MSVLETPRLYFRGRISWDPVTTNNHSQQYDEDKSETVFSPPDATDPALFRQAAIKDVVNGNWNPDGTYRSPFNETRIVGLDFGQGTVVDDPIVSTPVSFIGMLVDLEPFGSYSSQLFFDEMTFGVHGGCSIKALRETRMTARYINMNRYVPRTGPKLAIAGVASVTWQTSFPTDHLTIGGINSPFLRKLQDCLHGQKGYSDVIGLTVRWTAYRTSYFDALCGNAELQPYQKKLQDKLRLGGFQPNPARSEIVGVLGLWRQGEPVSEPGDRALLPPPVPAKRPASYSRPLLAAVHVRASGDTLALDLSNAVPEVDTAGTKLDLGDIVVTGRSPDPAIVDFEVARIPYARYDRAAYDASAGIVTLDVPGVERAIAGLTLAITCPSPPAQLPAGAASLDEAAVRAIPGEYSPRNRLDGPGSALPRSPNVYVDQYDSRTLQVLVLERGRPAGAGVPVYVARTDHEGAITGYDPAPLTTDANGIASLTVTGVKGAVDGYIFMDKAMKDEFSGPTASVAQAIDTQRTPYAYVRTLAADGDIAEKNPDWATVYEQVLRNWKAMAPCMDNWMRLDDEKQVLFYKPIVKKLTDENNFECFRYMPVTRDLTRGSRTLLYRFLDGPSNTVAVAGPPAWDATAPSRALRGG